MPIFALILGLMTLGPPGDDPPAGTLEMSRAVACKKISGFGDYEPLDEAVLTRDEKLLVYYEPSGFEYEKAGKEYRVHLVQDGRIRRRGEKKVLQSKDKLLDYKGTSPTPPLNIYLANTIALKGLPPGEYDLEIILRDELAKGPSVRQILPFKVRAAKAPDPPPEAPEKKSRRR